MMSPPAYVDLTLGRAVALADDPVTLALLSSLNSRVMGIRGDMDRFRAWCLRADQLYYAERQTAGGADLWPDDPSVTEAGRSHVSVNSPSAYVDIPSALQGAFAPIENMLATDTTKEARAAAARMERVRAAWKRAEEWEAKFHKACVVKSLYGRTAGRIYYDKDKKRPCIEVVEQPRNLFMGYKTDAFEEVEWAAYVQRRDPNAVLEEFGVDVTSRKYREGDRDYLVPYVGEPFDTAPRPWLQDNNTVSIEVWDYWYRKPASKQGRGRKGDRYRHTKMSTWNVVVAGNMIVSGPFEYPEYDGVIPYVPLFNTFIPGVPDGRPDLYDVEPLIREHQEKVTAGSQMIASGTAGDYWQLVGPDAPTRVPTTLRPTRNQIVGPGPGNRIETITPFIAQFQLEQYLNRIDRDKAIVSGINDLLLGLAPAQVLSSSKAINALVAQFEARISMRRHLLYNWVRRTWNIAVDVWGHYDTTIKQIISDGSGELDLIAPSLNPRDELETATRALNLVNGKLWSQRTGMDAVGVDDPETEQDMIREERTDATMFPADVQVMAQLMGALQALGVQAPPQAQAQAQAQVASGQNDLRTALGAAIPQGTTATQGAEMQGVTPPEAQVAGAPGAALPFAQGPGQPSAQLQGLIQNGMAKGRIMTKQNLGGR